MERWHVLPDLFVLPDQQGHVGGKMFASVVNWRCQLTQVDLHNGHKTDVCVCVFRSMGSVDYKHPGV